MSRGKEAGRGGGGEEVASSWVQHSSRPLQTELKFFGLIGGRMTKMSKYECCPIAVQANRERAARNIQGMLTVASTCIFIKKFTKGTPIKILF